MRMLERRRTLGLPDVAIPTAEDVEAARREPETNPRAETSGIVREAMAQIASAPASEQILRPGTSPIDRMTPATGLTALASFTPAPGVPVVESPAPSAAVAQLAPEPQRPRRPRVSDVIARAVELTPASGVGDLVELDEARVDIGKVIARARTLAGLGEAEVDEMLNALQEHAAAPEAIDIDAASAELAKQLGGASVSRRARTMDTSARWSAPPAVMEVAVLDALDSIRAPSEGVMPSQARARSEDPETPVVARAASEPVAAPSEPVAVAAPEPEQPPVAEAEQPAIAARAEPERDSVTALEPLPPELDTPRASRFEASEQAQSDDEPLSDRAPVGDAEALGTAIAAVGRSVDHDKEPGEAEPLDSMDLEPVDPSEATVVGGIPDGPNPYVSRVLASETYAQEHAQLERSLDAQLAQAESDLDGAEFAGGMAYAESQAYADQIEARQQTYAPGVDYAGAHEPIAEHEPELHEQSEEDIEDLEEISDLDVLAEADADEPHEGESVPRQSETALGNLLNELDAGSERGRRETGDSAWRQSRQRLESPVQGRGESVDRSGFAGPRSAAEGRRGESVDRSGFAGPRSAAEGRRGESVDDFAARLAFDDDERPPSHVRGPSDGIDPPSGHYTVEAAPYPAGGPSDLEAALAEPSEEDYALESALEALDVGLDDVSLLRDSQPGVSLPGLPPKKRAPRSVDDIPTERPGSGPGKARRPSSSPAPAARGQRAPRASTDDGVLIDFDDEDEE
jgi:hypothetical protein